MKVFLDTNIFLEYFEKRREYQAVSCILDAIEDGRLKGKCINFDISNSYGIKTSRHLSSRTNRKTSNDSGYSTADGVDRRLES